MDKRYLKIAVCFFIVLAMGSCVYDFTPDSSELEGLDKPLVVIEGDIIAGGTTTVKLGYSKSVLKVEDENGNNDEVDFSGAVVWVESQTGEIWNGRHVSWDISKYEINTQSLPLDGQYRLCVSIPQRGEYRSAFKIVAVAPQIDSISYSIADGKTGIQFEVSTHGDSQEPLYCRWFYEEDWESNASITPRLGAQWIYGEENISFVELSEKEIERRIWCYSSGSSKDIYIGSTEKLSQNIINRARLNTVGASDRRISSLYAITVTQTAMDREAYKYWEGIKASISGTGGLFAPMPNEVRGNIVNETVPQETVLGYINVSTASVKRRLVYARDLLMYAKTCEEVMYADSLWMELYFAGQVPIRYEVDDKGKIIKNQVYWSSPDCADCRTFSNSTRPDWWPEGR